MTGTTNAAFRNLISLAPTPPKHILRLIDEAGLRGVAVILDGQISPRWIKFAHEHVYGRKPKKSSNNLK